MVQPLRTLPTWRKSSKEQSFCGISPVRTFTTVGSMIGVEMVATGPSTLSATTALPGSKIFTSPRPEVHFYGGDVWQAVREAIYGKPLAVWLLVWGEDAHERRLSTDQFVLQDGRIYRTQEAHERLQAICAR